MKQLLLSVLFLTSVQLFYSQTTFTIPCKCRGSNQSRVATVTSLNFSSGNQLGGLIENQVASGVTVNIPYTGGNSGDYTSQSFLSTGVTGMTATLSSGTLANGSDSLLFTISGTPATSGSAVFAVSFGGQSGNLTVNVSSAAITFNYTGSVQSFTVPLGVTKIVVDGYGGKGGHGSTSWNGRGGLGGRVQATYNVTSGTTIYVNVGGKGGSTVNSGGTTYQPLYNPWTPGNAQGGWNGGGDPGGTSGGGGGGATDIRINAPTLSNRIYVAGGGGGGGVQRRESQPGGDGGHGGGTTAGNGSTGGAGGTNQSASNPGLTRGPNGSGSAGAIGGNGGNQTTGGVSVNYNSTSGILGIGGTGGNNGRFGGGGGGGYYGGGGGGDSNGSDAGGGGGGGSSYTDPSATNVTHTQGYSLANGDGQVTITFE